MIKTISNSILDDFKLLPIGGNYEFKESKSEKCRFVKISAYGKSMALILDKETKKVVNFFNNSESKLTSMNDGVILVKKDDILIVLLIELKSDNHGNYLHQLKSGQNFVKYFLDQIKLATALNITHVEYRGILFKTEKENASKNTFRRSSIKYKDRNGLLCCEFRCGEEYKLIQFIENI